MIKSELLEEVRRTVVGKQVWVIAHGWIPCPECDGSGTVDYTTKDGATHKIKCPECDSTRHIKIQGHRVLAQSIDAVHISSQELIVKCADVVFFENCDGLPLLFETEAEAQAKCDRLNREAADGN